MKLIHDDMVANIVDTYARATEAQKTDGAAWYPTAFTIVDAIAKATGTDAVRVCYALAALSPRNPWRWNVADAYSYAAARRAGLTMPKATTFGRNRTSAWAALASDVAPWNTAAPKVNAFVAAIMGNPLSVVVDVWAFRVATGTTSKLTLRGADYVAIAAAYTDAAAILRILPRDLQAITWLVAQTEGLASHRAGRPDLAFKTGTPDFVRTLLA